MKGYLEHTTRPKGRWNRLIFLLMIVMAGIPAVTMAQKQANVWYFGKNAGLDFNGFDPMPLDNSRMDAPEGVASISDSTGKLIFYTDGVSIWNSSHVKVNSTELSGDLSSTQSATIVPDPGNPDQYFVFTTKPFTGDTTNLGGNYYIINIQQGGTGSIVYDYAAESGKGGLMKSSTEKFTAVPFTYDTDKIGYWFLMHEFNSNKFVKIKLDSVWHDPVDQWIGSIHQNDTIDDGTNRGAAGQMKVNDAGTWIALAVEGGKFFELFAFNKVSGMLSNPVKLPAGSSTDRFAYNYRAYGVEFSPTGKYYLSTIGGNYLYGTTRDGQVYQWDLDLASDQTQMIKNGQILYSNPAMECGDMQIGPNGKIYIAFQGKDYLGVINSPKFPECYFNEKGVRLTNNDTGLGGLSGLGLPATIPTGKNPEPFYFENLCLGDQTYFYITDQSGTSTSRNWVITNLTGGGSVQKTTSTNDFTYQFPAAGKYRVLLIIMKSGKPLRYTRDLTIHTLPSVQLIKDNTDSIYHLCHGSSIEMDAGPGAFYAWETDSINCRKRIITTSDDELKHDYRVLVTDYHGCVGWDTVIIQKEIPPTATHTSIKAFCARHDGSATVIPNGKVEYFTFNWENYPDEKSNVLSGLNGGDYVVKVTKKLTGCSINDTIHVDELGGTNVKFIHEKDTICPGEQITLKVDGASEVEWVSHPSLSGSEVTVTLDTTTVFMVNTITHDENRDCPTTISDTIWVFPKNPPDLGTDRTPCGNNPVKIDGGGNFIEWNWSDGQSGRYAWITHDIDALILQVKDQNHCVFADTIRVHYLPGPVVNLGRDTAVCSKDAIKLTGGTGDSYLWSTGETTQSIMVNKTGNYDLTISQNGCNVADTIHVQLNDPRKLIINSVTYTDVSCYGAANGSIRIVASGDGRDWYYSIDNGLTYLDNDGLFENIGPGDRYIIKVLEDSVCTTAYPDPVAVTQPDPLMLKYCALAPSCKDCSDGEISLTINGGTPPYIIRMNDLVQALPEIKGLTIGEYQFLITDSDNCTTADTVSLVEGSRPEIVSDNGPAICSGIPKTLKVINSTSVEWINPTGEQGLEIVVYPTKNTLYTAKAINTDASGFRCETMVDYTVEVVPAVKPDLGEDIAKCEGDTVELDGGDYVDWSWSNGMSGRNIILTESPSNPLILTVTDEFGCVLKDTLSVIFYSHPAIDLGQDQAVCSSEPIVLNGGAGDSYSWTSSTLTSEVHTPDLAVTASGTYYLQITTHGCSSRDSVNLKILNPDSLTINSVRVTDNSCFGGEAGSLEILVSGTGKSYLYSIDNGDSYQTDNLFVNLPAGDDYYIRIFADSLCYKDYGAPVTVSQPDSIQVSYQLKSPWCETCSDGKLTLKISGGTPPYLITLSGTPIGLITETMSFGSYSLVVTDANLCTKTIDFDLDKRNIVPNVLTTNGDGINDLWKIPMLEYYSEAVVKVYSVAGKLVFESKPGYPEPWDGRDKGNQLPAGTYYYLINLGSGERQMTGYLTILR